MDTIKFLARRPITTLKEWLMDKHQIHSTWPSLVTIAIAGLAVIFSLAFFVPDGPVKPALIIAVVVIFFVLRIVEMHVDEAVKETAENPGLIYKAVALKAKRILEDKTDAEVTLGTYLSFVETIFSLPVNHRIALLKENDVFKILFNLKEMLKYEGAKRSELVFNPVSHESGNIFSTNTIEVSVDYTGRLTALLLTMQEGNITESPMETILMHTIEDALKK